MKTLKELVRPNIYNLEYANTARTGIADRESYVLLDADENPYNSPYNRYPDSSMTDIKILLSKVKGVAFDNIFVANGRSSLIDMLYRCFCRPTVDNVVSVAPSCGLCRKLAKINDVVYKEVLLDDNFQLSAEVLLNACDFNTKILWISSPNDVSGIVPNTKEVALVLEMFDGVVVIDESYSDFNKQPAWRSRLRDYPNLIVLNTLDNSWGCAAISVAMLYANSQIVDVLNKLRDCCMVESFAQKVALQQLREPFEAERWARSIAIERQRMVVAFKALPMCIKVYPSEANFLLVKFNDAMAIYNYLLTKGIIVKDCSKIEQCGDCLRIAVGSKIENNELLAALRQY